MNNVTDSAGNTNTDPLPPQDSAVHGGLRFAPLALGDWSPERRLTTAPTIDRHAILVAEDEGRLGPISDDHNREPAVGDNALFLIYENASCRDYHIGATTNRHLVVTRIDEDGLKTIEGGPLPVASEAPAAALDRHNRLWVAYRQVRGRHQGWATWLTSLDLRTGRWLPPQPVTTRKGPDRAPGLGDLRWAGVRGIGVRRFPNAVSQSRSVPGVHEPALCGDR